MKIIYKLILAFVVVTAVAAASSVSELYSYREINTSFGQLVNEPTKAVATLNALHMAGLQVISSTNEFGFIHSETYAAAKADELGNEEIAKIEDAMRSYAAALAAYENLVPSPGPEQSATIFRLRRIGERINQTSHGIIDLKKEKIRGDEILKAHNKFDELEGEFARTIDAAVERESAAQMAEQANVQRRISGAMRNTIVSTAVALILAILCGVIIAIQISRRVNGFTKTAGMIGAGNLDLEITTTGKDELGDLARAFQAMVKDLRRSRVAMAALNSDLTKERKRYVDTLDELPCVVWSSPFDPDSPEAEPYFVNGYVEDMFGYTPEEWLSDRNFWQSAIHPDDWEEMKRLIATSTHEPTMTSTSRWIRKDGGIVWGETHLAIYTDSTGKPAGLRGVTTDVTGRKKLEAQMAHDALHDPLTNLPNRVLFRDRVVHAVRRIKRSKTAISVLFLDLDNFKVVNDTLGHAAGDELLLAVTQRLNLCLRASDTAARFGGDEFAVLLEDIDDEQTTIRIAERIRSVLAEPYTISGKTVFVSTSVGIATTATGTETPEELLRNADVAMYRSKTSGKNRFTVFESEMHDAILKRSEVEADLRTAIANSEFEINYQPIVELDTNRVMGSEALIRWNHPKHGRISPMDFIPVAEDSGLIVPIGAWILKEACRQTREWQQRPECRDMSITVNVSTRQFMDDTLFSTVAAALAETGLPARCLILEITEGTMLSNAEATIARLNELKGLGIKFAVDDFGTGYSSLSYLQQFPVDILKIDKSFIDKISTGKEGAAVAKAIITMSETLHLRTIAEGVESSGQGVALQALGCELAQGYHFAKPLDPATMTKFLTNAVPPGEPDPRQTSTLIPAAQAAGYLSKQL